MGRRTTSAKSAGNRKSYYIALDNARSGEHIEVFGRYVKIVNASDANANVEIAIENNVPSQFRKLNNSGFIFEGDGFTQFFLKNAAQAGKWVEIIVSEGKQDFDVENQARDVIEEVAKPITTKGGNLGSYGAVSVGTTATEIIAADSDTTGWLIHNNDASETVFIGSDNSVTTANGVPVAAGEKISWDGQHDLYGIVASGSADVRKFVQKVS